MRGKRDGSTNSGDHLDSRLPERFWDKVEVAETSGCWLWTGARSGGYARFNDKGSSRLAHRVAYERLVGPIPLGLTLDHLCTNRACVNPAHLEPVKGSENIRRHYASQPPTVELVPVLTRLPPDVAEALKALAGRNYRSVSSQVRWLIEASVAEDRASLETAA